jgi:hypothetical protein
VPGSSGCASNAPALTATNASARRSPSDRTARLVQHQGSGHDGHGIAQQRCEPGHRDCSTGLVAELHADLSSRDALHEREQSQRQRVEEKSAGLHR